MKRHSKPALDLNTQFVRAYEWLRSNTELKNQYELAQLLGTSAGTVSQLINHKKPVTGEFAFRMNDILERHRLNLKDFNQDYLNNQARLAHQSEQESFESLISTEILRIQAGIEALLEKLSAIEKNMGELLKKTKKTGK